MSPPVFNVSRWKVIINLLLVYISWGSVYLGLKFTLEVLGPFLACGFRMVFGGVLLCAALLISGKWQKTTAADWKSSMKLAVFMVVMASGFLSKGQEYVSSGMAAIINGSTPISMLLGVWLFGGESRPTPLQFLGLAGGFTGLVMLAPAPTAEDLNDLWGGLWILLATFGWVAGTIATKKPPSRTQLPVLQSCGIMLLCGGLECLGIGFAAGEAEMTSWQYFNLSVGIAFAWMVIGGSAIAYSSYFWLVRHVPTPLAISYEYVVPIIGIFLGWFLGGEEPTTRMLCGCALITGSVFFVLQGKKNSTRSI